MPQEVRTKRKRKTRKELRRGERWLAVVDLDRLASVIGIVIALIILFYNAVIIEVSNGLLVFLRAAFAFAVVWCATFILLFLLRYYSLHYPEYHSAVDVEISDEPEDEESPGTEGDEINEEVA